MKGSGALTPGRDSVHVPGCPAPPRLWEEKSLHFLPRNDAEIAKNVYRRLSAGRRGEGGMRDTKTERRGSAKSDRGVREKINARQGSREEIVGDLAARARRESWTRKKGVAAAYSRRRMKRRRHARLSSRKLQLRGSSRARFFQHTCLMRIRIEK